MASAAELGRARTLDAAREIIARMAAALVSSDVTIEITTRKEALACELALPIDGAAGGERLAWLCASRTSGGGFSPDERSMLELLARLAGTRLESLQLFEREHRLAATLQDSIIPARLPEVPGLLLAAHYSPGNPEADVGGDWYDALLLPGGSVAVVAGDVVGRGVHAAAIMGQLRNAFRAFLLEGYTPADALSRLNGLVTTLGDAYFCTVACALIDPARGFARVACAGHTPPIVVTAEGVVRFQELVPSIAIGAIDDAVYSDTAVMLHPGDTLMLYTDGLVERRGRSLDVGLERLSEAAGAAGGDPAILVEHVVARMMRSGVGEDDVAAIAITVLPSSTDRLRIRLPSDPIHVAGLRRRLRDWLPVMGMGEDEVFDTVLAVSEAAANAIEHAIGPSVPSIDVSVAPAEGRVAVSVRDYGRWKDAPPEADRGRGLELIEALAEAPSIDKSQAGTTVSFRAALHKGSRS
jgi:serine phosphatase RsbU (regulator of sigma subunit)/anti-sigma regulatory factor (Ser/Thr protein kinase)